MKDDETKIVQQSIAQYLRNKPGFNVADIHDVTLLIDHVSQEAFYDSLCGETDADIKCVTVMCATGPENPIPPQEMRKQLLKLTHEHTEGQIERFIEIVITFGCGKWREPDKNNENPWYRIWPRAVIALGRIGEMPVRECNFWLSKNVLGYSREDFWFSKKGKDVIWSDANFLALQLITPDKPLHVEHEQSLQISCTDEDTKLQVIGGGYCRALPAGAKVVFEVKDRAVIQRSNVMEDMRDLYIDTSFNTLARDGETRISFSSDQSDLRLNEGQSAISQGPASFLLRECTCGTAKCTTLHRLEAWVPSPKISLRSFLASAIKGPQIDIKVGSFQQGMYLPMLTSMGTYKGDRVRAARVEFKLCQNIECESKDPLRKYDGDSCPHCPSGFDPEIIPKKDFEWLILITHPPVYTRELRYKCSQCKNLHTAEQCPLDNNPRGPRPKLVWVRNFIQNVPLADNA